MKTLEFLFGLGPSNVLIRREKENRQEICSVGVYPLPPNQANRQTVKHANTAKYFDYQVLDIELCDLPLIPRSIIRARIIVTGGLVRITWS